MNCLLCLDNGHFITGIAMKKLLKLVFALLLTITMVGCSKEEEKELLEVIKERGSIVIGTEGTWSPWTYHNEKDELVGFDVDVMRAIAKELGVECEFVVAEWDSLLAGIDSQRFDIVANGVEIDEARQKKYDFTDPYGYIRTALIVKKGNKDIKSFKDLDGKTTTNSLGSTYANLAESYGATNTPVDDLNKTFELVLQERADATLNAELSFQDYLKAHPDAKLEIVDLTEEASLVSLPVRKGAQTDSLVKAINDAIAKLSADGTLSQISNQYFGVDITKASK